MAEAAKKSDVALADNETENLPTHLREYKSTGVGVPTDQSDFLLPMAKVLDAKSPEVERRGVNYVPGAEPGDIYLKNAPVPLIKGETGFLFQLCHRDSAVIEWVPRSRGGGGGAGFAGRHPGDFITNSGDAEQRPHPENPNSRIWVRKSTGNHLVETRYYGGYCIDEKGKVPPMPLVLPFASTGHTVAKQWNMILASKRLSGKQVDIWLVYYRVRTKLRQRQDQSWYLFDISDAGPLRNGLPTTLWAPTAEDVMRGVSLHESLVKGTKTVDHEAAASAATEADNIPF